MSYISFLILNLKNTGLQIGHLKSKIPFLFLHLSELLKVECWNHWSKRQSKSTLLATLSQSLRFMLSA